MHSLGQTPATFTCERCMSRAAVIVASTGMRDCDALSGSCEVDCENGSDAHADAVADEKWLPVPRE